MELSSRQLPTGDFGSLEAADAESFAVVVVTKDKDRGYNSARRHWDENLCNFDIF